MSPTVSPLPGVTLLRLGVTDGYLQPHSGMQVLLAQGVTECWYLHDVGAHSPVPLTYGLKNSRERKITLQKV